MGMAKLQEVLATHMARLGWNPADLARASGLSPRSVYNWTGGIRESVRPAQARKLARALGVGVSVIMGESNAEVERALRAYLDSSYAKALEEDGVPVNEEEKGWLRGMIEAVWVESAPTPRTLHSLLTTVYRPNPELHRQ